MADEPTQVVARFAVADDRWSPPSRLGRFLKLCCTDFPRGTMIRSAGSPYAQVTPTGEWCRFGVKRKVSRATTLYLHTHDFRDAEVTIEVPDGQEATCRPG